MLEEFRQVMLRPGLNHEVDVRPKQSKSQDRYVVCETGTPYERIEKISSLGVDHRQSIPCGPRDVQVDTMGRHEEDCRMASSSPDQFLAVKSLPTADGSRHAFPP